MTTATPHESRGSLDEQHGFWERWLEDELPVLNLPSDFRRLPVQAFLRSAEQTTIGTADWHRLQALCTREQLPLFAVLLAAFATLLARYAQQRQLIIGVLATTSETAHGEDGVPQTNPLAVRVQLAAGCTAREWVARLEATVREVARHGSYPFADLVARAALDNNSSRAPVFQTMLLASDLPGAPRIEPAPAAALTESEAQRARCDLVLSVAEQQEGVVLTAEYDAQLFLPASVRRLLSSFTVILTALVNDLDRAVVQLPLLPVAEQELLEMAWSGAAIPFETEACFHELFERQAKRTPNASAVVARDEMLSYGELNRRANCLAARLRLLGVGPETPVGICVERSVDVVVGVLAIMKAGGVYVPLEMDAAPERTTYKLRDADISVLLTQRRLAGQFQAQDAPVVMVDDGLPPLRPEDALNQPARTTAHSLAYIVYTSGSTGLPKGVLVEHAGLINLISATISYFQLDAASRILQFTSLCFDGAILELGLALLSGGTLCIAAEQVVMSGPALVSFLEEQAVSMALLPPSVLAAMPAAELPALRTVVSVGEDCSTEVIARWAPGRRFFNGYGPTEATVATTVGPCSNGDEPSLIGRPLVNKRAYVLDQFLQPVPIGVAGELYVGGVGVARGYLNRSDLTAERFLPDPFSRGSAARMYRSGDLVRLRADGSFEFLGRADHQLKVRGFRVEPGEIEVVLEEHPSVRRALVTAEAGEQHRQLVAYLEAAEGGRLNARELLRLLRSRLPPYMVPAAFFEVTTMPLTPAGKVDRRALRGRVVQLSLKAPYTAPRTPAEELLAALWARVLGVDQVGILDNFFELGGHSLMVGEVVGEIRACFGVELQLHHLFEAPTIAQLADLVWAASVEPETTVAPESGRSEALSSDQQRIWFLEQWHPDSGLYNMYVAFRLVGKLDETLLERSLNEIVRRHTALRTVFATVDGVPVPTVVSETFLPLVRFDLHELAPDERAAALQQVVAEEAGRPFELNRAPLVRGGLLNLAQDEHVLVLTLHHMIADGRSIVILLREAGAIYQAFAAKRLSPLPEPTLQFADVIAWQQRKLTPARIEQLLAYWRQQLAGAPTSLALPTDWPRPAVETHRGGRQELNLPFALGRSLKGLARSEGATQFMVGLAVFGVLLSRYSAQTDLLIGAPVAVRPFGEAQDVVGFLVNTIVLRVRPGRHSSFRALLAHVRGVCIEAYRHQDLPFARLVEELQPERDLSRQPLVQVLFAWEHGQELFALPGVQAAPLSLHNGTAKFDLSLAVREEADRIVLSAEYNRDLFDDASAARMLRHYTRLLEAAMTDPDSLIERLPLIDSIERGQLLQSWNDTAQPYPEGVCLHTEIERQARCTPEAIAVEAGGQRLTYQQLDARAQRVANFLRQQGLRQETPVGLCVERSLDLVIGLLGILKAGCIYVPLDPTLPRERLRFMLEDSRVPLVLTQQHFLGSLPESPGAVYCLDRDWERINQAPDGRGAKVSPDILAYVIYTSGSTGVPKGVAVSHRATLNLLSAMRSLLPLDRDAVLAAVTPLSFDIATLELLLPLTVGARVAVIAREVAADGVALGRALADCRATVLQATPSTWHLLLESGWPGSAGLTMICGGETMTRQLADQLLQRGPVLWNVYGPTETTIWSTAEQVKPGGGHVSIGRPIANTTAYLLDYTMEPVPVGVPGELYIGGAGLARGYLGRPDLTAERFVPDPFGAAGDRLYRTGDLGRYRPDGAIEYLGRRDSQVKLRGFRIELGEIEAVLSAHSRVERAAVTVQEEGDSDRRLVAYIVGRGPEENLVQEVRAYLRARLPTPMLPAVVESLAALPLTPNGKIDRGALPRARGPMLSAHQDESLARGPVAEVVARVWAEILSIDDVGLHDGFFDIGGHSLLAARVVARLASLFRRELPLRSLFEAPTVAAFAQYLVATEAVPGQTERIAALIRAIKMMPKETRQALLQVKRQELGEP